MKIIGIFIFFLFSNFNLIADSILSGLEGTWLSEDDLKKDRGFFYGFNVTPKDGIYHFQVELNLRGLGYFPNVRAQRKENGMIYILYPHPKTQKEIIVAGLEYINRDQICIKFLKDKIFKECLWKFSKSPSNQKLSYWSVNGSGNIPPHDPDRKW